VTRRTCAALLLCPLLTLAADSKSKPVKQREVKIQKTSITREREIALGKEAAAQVESQMEVVNNPEIEAWLNRIGQQLAQTPQANSYPYHFKIVNEDSINAFALPGGPMFVHTGLIKAADNEGQLVGVLAHEMSHVALRHGASQMGRSQIWQTILGAASAAAGGGLLGTAVNAGAGLGVGSLLGKYSRDAERDADLNGARMAAAAGYNPLEVANFFEKLEALSGSASRPKGLDAWLSSHPAPGRRVEYISEDLQFYTPREYKASTGEFTRIKTLVDGIAPPKMKPAVALAPVQAEPRQALPQGFADLQTKDFAIAYPRGWQAGKSQQGGALYIVPQGGAARGPNGGIELITGAMIDYYVPQNGTADLTAITNALLASLRQGDPNMKIEKTQPIQLGGKSALVTRMSTRTSSPRDSQQILELYTVIRTAGLWMMALALPESGAADAERVFRQMIGTVAFTD
jgi:beta-barrel assembly-enhancing protease